MMMKDIIWDNDELLLYKENREIIERIMIVTKIFIKILSSLYHF